MANGNGNAEWISTPETAKIVRVELAKAFPGIKFSVRSQSYSGGSHINIGWTDGPTTQQVEKITSRFCGRTFDGMDDSTHHHDTEWQGHKVHFAGSAPSVSAAREQLRRVGAHGAGDDLETLPV